MNLLLSMMLTVSMVGSQADPVEIAARVQKVYDNEQCLSSDFIQIYRSGTSGKTIEETGKLVIKKPGKMRWDYLKPEKKLYVSDGTTVYWYVAEDRQVTKINLEDADQEQAQILFLTGRGNLVKDFEISNTEEIAPLHPQSFMLRLKPKKEQDFDYLILEVNPRDYYVERILTFDPLGNMTEYRFLNIHRDNKSDDYFKFEIPRGVEVLEGNQ